MSIYELMRRKAALKRRYDQGDWDADMDAAYERINQQIAAAQAEPAQHNERCPTCGAGVESIFDHVDKDCAA